MFRGVPKSVLIISLLGLIPIFIGSLLSFKLKIIPLEETTFLLKASLQYSSFILCFLSGCVFFSCLNKPEKTGYLWYSIIPVILSLFALSFPFLTGFILALGFLYLLEIERNLFKTQVMPIWWINLRMPMTILVLICLIIMGFNV
tara:strand:- start:90 stop:524 length:435 start_codon:yes stop_codon:yes gene_type:complete